MEQPILEDHDVLAWLVRHAAAKVNWFRPGLDGKTLQAQVGQGRNMWTESVGKADCKKEMSSASSDQHLAVVFSPLFGSCQQETAI